MVGTMNKIGLAAVREVTTFTALARHLDITRGAISQWDRIPEERLEAVSAFTGLPKHVLRPDLFTGYVPAVVV